MTILTKIPQGAGQIIETLQSSEELTLEEIDKKHPDLDLPTIRYAIRRLLEAQIILSIPELMDMRTVKYRMASKSSIRDALENLSPEIVEELQKFLETNHK